MRSSLSGWLVSGAVALAAIAATLPVHAGGAPGSAVYTALAPCRIADTRLATAGDLINASAIIMAEVGSSAVQVFTLNGATSADHRFSFIAVAPR